MDATAAITKDGMITSGNVKWLAGLLEGEGTFVESGTTIQLRLGMTDEDVVARAASLLGSAYVSRPGKQPRYRTLFVTAVYGRHAAEWMMTLYREMGSRRRLAIAAALAGWRRREIAPQHRSLCPYGHAYTQYKFGRGCRPCYARRARERRARLAS